MCASNKKALLKRINNQLFEIIAAITGVETPVCEDYSENSGLKPEFSL